ncbi:MAG: sulfatase-like hydrolase/transferase [Actinomycetota bacterium]
MTRSVRGLLHNATAASCVALLSLGVLVAACTGASRDERPNLILFITDDESVGSTEVMPHLRSWFVESGRSFEPGFVTTPLCCPSRASILSGRYMHNHGVRLNREAENLDLDETLQRHLSAGGYRTGIVGKFLNAWPSDRDPPDFDYFVVSKGFPFEGGTWNVNGDTQDVATYSTTFIRDHVAEFLETTDAGTPWLLIVSTIAPHAPAIPEPKYADAPVPPPTTNPALEVTDRSAKLPLGSKRSFQTRPRFRADQLRTMMSVDDVIGDVDRALEERDEKSDTLAFYISDNGLLRGEHGLTGKGHPLRPAVEVPFYMAWPGRIEPSTDDRLAANIDIAPTMMDAAGLLDEIDHPLDGRSLLEDWRRAEILLEYQRNPKFVSPSWASIRTDVAQYIEYYDQAGETRFRELYDLADDEWQLTNLLGGGRKTHHGAAAAFGERLERYRRCSGSGCP